ALLRSLRMAPGMTDAVEPVVTAPSRLRRTRLALWTAVAVAVPSVALVAVLATRPPATTTAVRSPLIGRPAPDAAGTTLDGRHVLDLRVAGVPESFLASPEGVVAAKVRGGVRLAQLERLLDEAKARSS